MGRLFLLVSIFLPVLCGVLMLAKPIQGDRARRAYCEGAACATTFFVWLAILTGMGDTFVIYSFTSAFAIRFHIDGLTALFAGLVSVMWPLVTLYAFEYMERDERKNMFFAFFTMTYGITLGVAFSGDLVTMYVFYEMLTLVTIPLVGFYQNHESMYAARVYAAYIIGGAALGFACVVIVTLQNGGIFTYGGAVLNSATTLIMQCFYLFGFFGFGVKAAIFPVHHWLPVASAAPTPVTALLHAVAVVNSGVFALMRLTYYTFDPKVLVGTWVQGLCLGVAAFTLLYAAARAVRERHFKKRLAYSTVSNLSYMLFGVMLLSEAGLRAGISHMVFHSVIKITLFLCAGAFMHGTGKNYLYEINGVGKRMPVTFACYTLGALSLTGIPLFCGFVSKWQLLKAGGEAGTTMATIGMVCLILSAFLCAIYTLTVSARAFYPQSGADRYAPAPGETPVREAGWRMLAPIVFFTVLNVLLGVCPQIVMGFIGRIASGAI